MSPLSQYWEHENDTVVSAMKSDRGYYIPYPVKVGSHVMLKKLDQIVMSLVSEALILGKMLIPPPWYVHGGCCDKPGHNRNGCYEDPVRHGPPTDPNVSTMNFLTQGFFAPVTFYPKSGLNNHSIPKPLVCTPKS